jgi:phosphopantothenoylcysteine synthetase/decarboxylase
MRLKKSTVYHFKRHILTFQGSVGDEMCICSRIALSFYKTPYFKMCGTCEMTLVPGGDMEEANRRELKKVKSELKRAVRKQRKEERRSENFKAADDDDDDDDDDDQDDDNDD